jgi:hypothetical protein
MAQDFEHEGAYMVRDGAARLAGAQHWRLHDDDEDARRALGLAR